MSKGDRRKARHPRAQDPKRALSEGESARRRHDEIVEAGAGDWTSRQISEIARREAARQAAHTKRNRSGGSAVGRRTAANRSVNPR